MRRIPPVPPIDLTAMMGLSALLIAMLLVSTPPLATIDSSLPGFWQHPHDDQVLVPTVRITPNDIQVHLNDHPIAVATDPQELILVLAAVRTNHFVGPKWLLQPHSNAPYEQIVDVMDAARSADFIDFVIAPQPPA